ncbi:glycosyl hydrolase family 18 protein [Arthrobacter glacialis]|uniref:glycosyl hydrolase family 18 protein n=1 Tax=Arthrobacter glacialis TaxID=1664 RepID=UPI0013FD8BDF|nr:glycosyl hydrolase family 18 protein [Arthrobacter glacialis]
MLKQKVIAGLGIMAITIPLVACASASEASQPPSASRALPVEGYLMTADGASKFVDQSAAALAMVGVDGINLTPDGAGLTEMPASAAPIVAATHAHGLTAELLVGNFDKTIEDFSPEIATALLSSPSNRTKVIKLLVDDVVRGGYDGLQLDMESLNASHGAGLASFAKDLKAALPAKTKLSMALMATDTAAGYADEGYQLTALNKSVDRFVLMAYDQHGPTWTEAGPIGGSPWVKSVLGAFIAAGAPKSKIDLGVAEYAYTWPGNGTPGEQLTVAQARAKAGNKARFDAVQGEWTATLSDGTVIWWSDALTLAGRTKMAQQYGVHGLAIWELSLGDPLV